jgi:hypothetical protein
MGFGAAEQQFVGKDGARSFAAERIRTDHLT